MKFATLSSSSSGNATLVSTDKTNILIDAGIGIKALKESLSQFQLTFKDIDAVFLTHEHTDHIKGVGSILRMKDIPIIGTRGTLSGVIDCFKIEEKINGKAILPGDLVTIEDLEIEPFSISHDSREPVAYTLRSGDRTLTIATDLGKMTRRVYDQLQHSDAILLEANYDEELLKKGPYPYYLKERIRSDKGHLSNDIASKTVAKLLEDGKNPKIILGHLSKTNNYPRLAMDTLCHRLRGMGVDPFCDVDIHVADRLNPSDYYDLKK